MALSGDDMAKAEHGRGEGQPCPRCFKKAFEWAFENRDNPLAEPPPELAADLREQIREYPAVVLAFYNIAVATVGGRCPYHLRARFRLEIAREVYGFDRCPGGDGAESKSRSHQVRSIVLRGATAGNN
jgi:hypothetical protein